MSSSQTPIIHRALSVMVADTKSPLDREERTACLCWLQGQPCNIVILVPCDIASNLMAYIGNTHPELADELYAALAGTIEISPPTARFDSPLENDFWLEWEQQALEGVYPLTPQYPIKDGQYRLDFAYPPLRVGIELDGYTYHSDREQFTKDRHRHREIEAQGWRIIRFSGDELRKDLVRCVQEAARFLSEQGHRQQGQPREDLPNPFFDLEPPRGE